MIFSNRIFFEWTMLLGMLSASTFAQEAEIPAFDSFSYLRDSQFNSTRINLPGVPVEAVKTAAFPAQTEVRTAPAIEDKESPVISAEQTLSQEERSEFQLALDKAVSQILKLTVDYESLRNRVQKLDAASDSAQVAQPDRSELQDLLDSRAEQLADRDQQLSRLQSRYDSELASRLLAEKQLKATADTGENTQYSGNESNEIIRDLSRQLADKQASIKRLETELAAADLKMAGRSLQSDAAQGSVENETGSPYRVSSEWVVEGLKFKHGSAEIQSGSTENLDTIVAHLKQNPALSVQVNGYTDSVGSIESNLRLSQARAESAADYLTARGIKFYRIKALGYGERRSVGDNTTEQGRQQNRRVSVLFLD